MEREVIGGISSRWVKGIHPSDTDLDGTGFIF
jgi:hypothetical protein